MSFSVGNGMSLGLETEKSDDKWFLFVRTAQDYETQTQRTYRFTVEVAGVRYNVVINVENVDDQPPFFLLPDSTCHVSVSNRINTQRSDSGLRYIPITTKQTPLNLTSVRNIIILLKKKFHHHPQTPITLFKIRVYISHNLCNVYPVTNN